MNFEDKFSKAVNDVVSGEQGVTIEEIREKLEEDYEYTLELKHGSKNFQGEKLELGQAGSRRDQKNDAYGTGFYMTNKETIARAYAGKEGQIVVADFTITEENTSNFMYPYDHREFLEEVVLGSPDAYSYFINSYEASAPPYDHDFECYQCPETCEEIECTYDEYLETFGGLRDIFRSRYFMPMNDKSANNPIDDFVAGLMNEDSLYDALMTVEGELYCPNSSDTQKNVLAANLLNEKKAEYGIQAGLVDEGEGSLVVVITDPDAIDIKEIQQLKPKSQSLKL